MDLIQAIVLGVVQGLTEFLPISSTAHIRILPALLGWPDPGAAFTAAIQLGTLVAVFIYFWGDLVRAFTGWVRGLGDPKARRTDEWRLGWAIVVGTIPVVIAGVLFKDKIENDWRSLYVISASLIGMGILLAVAEVYGKKFRDLRAVTVRDGLWVGLWQAVALIPGSSRSGSTITGALMFGFDRPTAARFSFLLSVPSILAAAIFNLKEHQAVLLNPSGGQFLPMIVANLAALISGYAAIAFLIRFLQKKGTMPFVVYRIALGILMIVLLQTGVLQPDAGLQNSPTNQIESLQR